MSPWTQLSVLESHQTKVDPLAEATRDDRRCRRRENL